MSTAGELEITNYKKSPDGVMHYVTVAFQDMSTIGIVRCIISKDNKPVGMRTRGVEGVGTIDVFIKGGIDSKTTASCEEIERPAGN